MPMTATKIEAAHADCVPAESVRAKPSKRRATRPRAAAAAAVRANGIRPGDPCSPPERGARPAPDERVRSAGGVSRSRRVAQPPARGGREGQRRDRRHRHRRGVRRRADHRGAAPRQPGAGHVAGAWTRSSRPSSCSARRPCRRWRGGCGPSTSSSAPACGTRRPSASGCTRWPPSTRPTGSRPRSAMSTATA